MHLTKSNPVSQERLQSQPYAAVAASVSVVVDRVVHRRSTGVTTEEKSEVDLFGGWWKTHLDLFSLVCRKRVKLKDVKCQVLVLQFRGSSRATKVAEEIFNCPTTPPTNTLIQYPRPVPIPPPFTGYGVGLTIDGDIQFDYRLQILNKGDKLPQIMFTNNDNLFKKH